jgi:hypothetical protein
VASREVSEQCGLAVNCAVHELFGGFSGIMQNESLLIQTLREADAINSQKTAMKENFRLTDDVQPHFGVNDFNGLVAAGQ